MRLSRFLPMVALLFLTGLVAPARPEGEKKEVKEKSLDAPNGLTIKVRMEGPYDADTPLQIVCYFKHKKSGDKTLALRSNWTRSSAASSPRSATGVSSGATSWRRFC